MTTFFATSLSTRVAASWPWYIVRASGLSAAALLVLSALTGIGQLTGLLYRYMEPLKVWALHRAIGLALAAAVILHISFLLVDKFVPFNLAQILVPFTASFRPLWTGFGTISLYLLAAIIVTSVYFLERFKRTWRVTHYASYAVVPLIFFHALFTGTDLASGILRLVWLLLGGVLAVTIVLRLLRSGSLRRR